MRKTLAVIFLFVLLGLFPVMLVNANSAPIINDGPGQHGLIPLVDNEIDIVKEELVFDFRDMNSFYGDPIAKVTATYQMKNTKTETITMAFPLLTNERGIQNAVITANSVDLTPTIYYGPYMRFDEFKKMTIDEIIDELYDDDYSPIFNEYGFLYTFEFGLSTSFDVVVPKINGQRIVYDGFNQYSQDASSLTFTATSSMIINKGMPSLFIINGEPDFPERTHDKNLMSLQDYLTLVSESTPYNSIQYNNLLSRLVDERFSNGFYTFSIQSVLEEVNMYRLMVLIYDVPLLGDDFENIVSVTYETEGRRHNRYNPPIYEYEYFLLPASLYRSFSDLTVKIYPNATEKYLIGSNMEFVEEEGYYVSFSEELPEENLTFQISRSESPSKSSNWFLGFAMITLFIGAALLPASVIVLVVVVIVVTRKRKRRL